MDTNPEVLAAAILASQTVHLDQVDLGYLRRRTGSSLISKLESIWDEYELGQANSDLIELSEHRDVDDWSKSWKWRLREKVWLLDQATSAAEIPKDARDVIVKFTDILPDFRLARKTIAVRPVVEALARFDLGVEDFLQRSADEESNDSEDDSD